MKTYTEITQGWRDGIIEERRSRAVALRAVIVISLALWAAIGALVWQLFG